MHTMSDIETIPMSCSAVYNAYNVGYRDDSNELFSSLQCIQCIDVIVCISYVQSQA